MRLALTPGQEPILMEESMTYLQMIRAMFGIMIPPQLLAIYWPLDYAAASHSKAPMPAYLLTPTDVNASHVDDLGETQEMTA